MFFLVIPTSNYSLQFHCILTNLIEIFCFQIEDNWPSIYKMAFEHGQTVYVHKLQGVQIKMPAIIHGNPYSSGGIEMVNLTSRAALVW